MNVVLNYLVILFSLSGLAYQTWELLGSYIAKTTLVNLKFTFIKEDHHPGITICAQSTSYYPAFSTRSLAKIYPEFGEQFNMIIEQYRNLFELTFNNNKNEKIDLAEINSTVEDFIETWYSNYTDKLDDAMDEEMDLFNFLNNYTWSENELGLNLEFTGFPTKQDGLIRNDLNNDYLYAGHPVVSVGSRHHKYFTYYSFLDERSKLMKLKDLSAINIYIRPDFRTFHHKLIENFYFAVHSPNVLPSFYENYFIPLDIDQAYEIKISQVEINRYSPGYDTDCFDYEDEMSMVNFRSDCVLECLKINSQNYTGKAGSTRMIHQGIISR